MALWEVAILHKVGRVRLSQPFSRWAERLLLQPGYELAAFTPADIAESVKCNINDDMFDGAIVAAATTRDLPLITRDGAIIDSGMVRVIW